MLLKDKSISIKTIEDLLRCTNLASMLELSGYPKPGNVHRTRDFKDTRFEHFLAGIAAIQPSFRTLCIRSYENSSTELKNYNYVELGSFFNDAAEEMMKWQKGGNVLLGHILILGPLASSGAVCLKRNKLTYNDYSDTIRGIINDTSVEDTIELYKAIRKCNPGGLGKVDRYDLNDENSIEEIKRDKITLKKIFEFSKDHDLIGLEYSTNFKITLNEGLPYFIEVFNRTKDINIAIVNTFLKILSEYQDSLIIRKAGIDDALLVSKKASELIKAGGINSKNGIKLIKEFDISLQRQEGRLNPGTTADLVAGVIFCALLFGLKY